MAEAAFKQMIATFIRQTRPQTFRQGKPFRYPQRSVSTAAAGPEVLDHKSTPAWQTHHLPPSDDPTDSHQKPRLQRLRTESEPRSFSSFLTDNYSREHNYLRISLTERCNLRCLYCMPEEGIQLSPPDHILTTPEIVYLSSLFVDQGVNKIRLTGGEPTVRKDILDLMRQIGSLRSNGLKELCLTTNGISLHRKLDSMLESGLTGVNLSLDTLDPFQFTIMTRRNGHEAVMKSINRILEMNELGAGIKLKINCVVMRGLNDKEILPFVELGREKDLEVRFIEYMPFDGNKWSQKKMLGYQEMLALIRQKYPEVHKVQDHPNDTSKTYKVPGFVGRIGFITSMTHNFCGTCNRLRITSDGNLKVCLFGNSEVSLRDILRESNGNRPIDAEAMEAIRQVELNRKQALSGSTGALGVSEQEARLLDVIGVAVKRKKEKHAGMGELENMKNRPMILIDGIPHAQPSHTAYQVQPPLRVPLPLLAVRSSTAFSRSIPSYLLTHNQPGMFQQHRYRSTFLSRRTYITRNHLFRYVWTQSKFRRICIDILPHPRSIELVRKVKSVQQHFNDIARRVRKPLRFTTMASSRFDTSHPSHTGLTHLTSTGAAHMVDVGRKRVTHRSATAVSYLLFSKLATYEALVSANVKKGDALAVARLAGIQAAKKTSDLIPLAHPGLGITAVSIDVEPMPVSAQQDHPADNSNLATNEHGGVSISATVECYGKTGVEMEALTATNVAALTMYDMLKGIDKAMLITGSRVVEKRGGKSGAWRWNNTTKQIEKFDETLIEAANPLEVSAAQPEHDHHADEFQPYTPTSPNQDHDPINLQFTPPPPSSTPSNPDEPNAQSIFKAEWDDLTSSFSQTTPQQQQPQSQSSAQIPPINTSYATDDQTHNPHEGPRLRDALSGSAHTKPDTRSFRLARIQRYEEWKKSR